MPYKNAEKQRRYNTEFQRRKRLLFKHRRAILADLGLLGGDGKVLPFVVIQHPPVREVGKEEHDEVG